MQVKTTNLSDTKVQLVIVADAKLLQAAKKEALQALANGAKVPGFRGGKAPLNMVEKQADPARLQSGFLDVAVERLYSGAVSQEKLRPVSNPDVKITKFVPFDSLELEIEIEVIGEVKLGDYKKIKQAPEKVTVSAKDVDAVLQDLSTRDADRTDVDRAAKNGDQIVIDFEGKDAKTSDPISGADGKDYPLVLGSNTFIPGFEPELIGLKTGAQKTFTITFPKDYGVKTLQNRKVTFNITVKKVQEIVTPKLDDAFAAKIGPFKSLAELKDDIKKELLSRKTADADVKYADELVLKLTEKSKLAVPEILINEQLERFERDQRQNLTYRGQTWQEFLEAEGLTEQTYRDKNRAEAEKRVKAALVLAEVAEAEDLLVTNQDIEDQIAILKAQYPDAQMQAELAKPESRRSIASRILTQKTVDKLKEYAQAK